MINKRILLSGLSIVTAFTLMAGGTFAFFSDTATSETNSFGTGTLSIEIDQDDQVGGINPVISNLAPGQSTTVLFDVNNNGSLPVNLRGFAVGSWSGEFGSETPDPTLMKVTLVEYWNGSAWTPIVSDSEGLSGEFYYSPNGQNLSLFELAAGDHEDFRLTVELDDSASDLYQGKSFNASITADAKQTNAAW